MGLDLLELAAVGQVPKTDELILPGGGERLAIRREGDGKNRSFMRGPGQALGQVGGVPKGHFSRISRCVAGGDEQPAIGAERERADTPGQAVEFPCRDPVCGVPEYHFPVSAGSQVPAVGAPYDGLDDVAVAGELGQAGRFFFSHAVDDYLVAVSCSQALVVWRKGECEHRSITSRQIAQFFGGGSLFFYIQLFRQPDCAGGDPLAERGDVVVAQLFLGRHMRVAVRLEKLDESAPARVTLGEGRTFIATNQRCLSLCEIEVALGFVRVMTADTVVAEQMHRALGQGRSCCLRRSGGRPGEAEAKRNHSRLGQALGQAGGCLCSGPVQRVAPFNRPRPAEASPVFSSNNIRFILAN